MTATCPALGVLLTVISLMASCVTAQASPQPQPAPRITGVVMDAATKAPVAGAIVSAPCTSGRT